jgi:diguanylate cyclase (GGDEF)-like protein
VFEFAVLTSVEVALPLLVTFFGALCYVVVALMAWQNQSTRLADPLRWSGLFGALGLLGYAWEVADMSLAGSVFAFNVKLTFVLLAVFFQFVFILRYTGLRWTWTVWQWLCVLVMLCLLLLLWTNPWHEWFVIKPYLIKSVDWKPLYRERFGYGFGIYEVMVLLLATVGMGRLWVFASRISRIYLPQAVCITVGILGPLILSALVALSLPFYVFAWQDYATLGFVLTAACLLLAVTRFGLLETNPEAWGEGLGISNDAEIVIRADRSLVDANRPALRLLEDATVGPALRTLLAEADLNSVAFVRCAGRDFRFHPTVLQGSAKLSTANLGSARQRKADQSLDASPQAFAYHLTLHDVTELKHQERLLHELSIRDGLTGLFNRRYLDGFLEQAAQARVNRKQGLASGSHLLGSDPIGEATNDLGVVLFDLDHFRQVNAKLGHPAGDHVLKRIGTHLLERASDDFVPCRYGGEEFCVLLPGHSSDEAQREAERLCDEVRDLEIIFEGRRISVTISVAVASWREHGELTLLAVADDALRRAKLMGRNRVERPSPVRSTWGIGWG